MRPTLDSAPPRADIFPMRLPDSFLDELRHRLSLSQVVGRKVVWDLKKTNQGRGDWWAPCPFHQEKTASFHVDDRKGFYYCFGCQAKGNLFGFVQETENVGFMEAVEILAAEAGMTMPARDPRAAERTDHRARLAEICEMAARWYRTQLGTRAAAEARRYLEGRGLLPETLERFEIGFAPAARDAKDLLLRHLAGKGVAPDLVEAAGLSTVDDGADAPRDRFLDRIVFPIRDGRGRAIGFGGRAMNPRAKAKYLNSPETALFDKGANLYNLAPARTAAGRGEALILAEGYMDVIALVQAGIEAAVAPLGTAVTERQLRLLWRCAPEPVVALDGDAAGTRAGLRLADLALPLIEAGQSLRFARLPEGQDPDDLVRAGGAAAMRALVDGAEPMAALLWRRATEGQPLDSPERRAAFDRDLRDLVRRIADPSVRRHYADAFARRRGELFGPAPGARGGDGRFDAPRRRDGGTWQTRSPRLPGPPAPTTRASAVAAGLLPDAMLEQVALAGLALHPALVDEVAEALERAQWRDGDHGRLAEALLALPPGSGPDEAREALRARGWLPALERLLGLAHVRITPAGRPGADAAAALACIRDALARLDARRGAERERDEAVEDYAAGPGRGADETLTWRLAQANRRRDAASRAPQGDTGTEADAEAARSAHLQSLLDTRVWEKTKSR